MNGRFVVVAVLGAWLFVWGCGSKDRPESGKAAAPAPEKEPEPAAPEEEGPAEGQAKEGQIAEEGPLLAIDTHVDTTQRMLDDGDDIAERLEGGHLDIPRMREGGLTGAFFSIWVNPRRYPGEKAWERALALIDAVRAVANKHPDKARMAVTGEDVRRAASEGQVALLMGVEGGHALGTDDPELALERLRKFHELGVRYMTITWSTDNPLGHASTGKNPKGGLTDMGRRVVAEMNRIGMIVDVSHVSDRTFADIMDVTKRPVMASHSSARALAEHPRNMTDAMIRRVAEGGGAVCINYFSQYIDVGYRARLDALKKEHKERFDALEQEHSKWSDRARAAAVLAREIDPQIGPPTVATLGAHFAHVAKVGGPRAVCLGSDYDGVPELPDGHEDVSKLPALRAELERRGLPIRPIFGGNVLRVLDAQGPG